MNIDLYPQGVEEQARSTLAQAVRRSGDGEIIAVTSGPRFEASLFGETHVTQAEMYGYLPQERDRALASLIYLLRHQGKTYNDLTEEEPGRIFHEQRTIEMADHLKPREASAARTFLHILGNQWINQNDIRRPWKPQDGLIFYGSDENTLRTARVAARVLTAAYTEQKTYGLHSGDFISALGLYSHHIPYIQSSFDAMVAWTETRISHSDIGLFTNKPMNEHALWPHTQWNSTGNLYHASGEPLNNQGGYASLICQGLSYDVLAAAAQVEKLRPQGTETRAKGYTQQAKALAERVAERFIARSDTANPYVYPALDQHPITGEWRQQQMATSDALETLETDLWKRPGGDTMLRHIIAQCFSPSFLTSGGIRFHSKEHAGNFIYTQGAYAVDIERNLRGVIGLQRYGYTQTAYELFARVTCLLQTLGHIPIEAYFDKSGHRLASEVGYWPQGAHKLIGEPAARTLQIYHGEEYPRRNAVPASALMRICYAILSDRDQPKTSSPEKKAFEDTLPVDTLYSVPTSGYAPTAYAASQMPALYLEHLTDRAQPLHLILPEAEDLSADFSLRR